MILDTYRCLIANLPAHQHASTSRRETWQKRITPIPRHLAEIFGTSPTATISRGDLFCMAGAADIQQFVYGVILWGYPNGMQGNNFVNLVNGMGQLEGLIGGIRNNGNQIPDWNEHWPNTNTIDGLGLSTYSKILYFMNTRANGNRCLILDQVLIGVFATRKFDEFEQIGGITYENSTTKYYISYLELMERESSRLGVTADQLEMFLFMFGPVLK
ncbi:MAG: hypothetical protein KAT56_02745 [Sedimentisphaerales bacterium]|nr:hypothetical protein [Sedimentisphaerales bacterium]